jgi:hypothetical protein
MGRRLRARPDNAVHDLEHTARGERGAFLGRELVPHERLAFEERFHFLDVERRRCRQRHRERRAQVRHEATVERVESRAARHRLREQTVECGAEDADVAERRRAVEAGAHCGESRVGTFTRVRIEAPGLAAGTRDGDRVLQPFEHTQHPVPMRAEKRQVDFLIRMRGERRRERREAEREQEPVPRPHPLHLRIMPPPCASKRRK